MDADKLRYLVERLRGFVRPRVTVRPAPEAEIVFERDVPVTMRDGTVLRVNVFRPPGDGPHPAIMCAHPYGKDNLPEPKRGGGFKPSIQYRIFRMPEPVAFSAWTGWESPDPAHWVPRGYVLVNCDLRGCGTSEGIGDLLSPAESGDYHDLIEWAGAQPWCSGKVGLNGVSYLALSQYGAAATQPPSLAAICPWEGFSDPYRDLLYPGGVREDGFIKVWEKGLTKNRLRYHLRNEQLARPLPDEFWAELTPDLTKVEVPMLVCGSFSDNNLHSRGSIRAFEGVASKERWLYTHRGGKWATYYSEAALAAQERFFDHFLKGVDNGQDALPPVRLEVREDRDTIREVRHVNSWPPPGVRWTDLLLGADGRLTDAEPAAAEVRFATAGELATWTWTIPRDLELSGPMTLRLRLAIEGAAEANLFAAVEKWRAGRFVPFEGSYGFGYDRVTTGWRKVTDPSPDDEIEVELGPSATWFRAGEQLRLVLGGRWLHPTNPVTGQFPAKYEPSPDCTVRVLCGGAPAARLSVPLID